MERQEKIIDASVVIKWFAEEEDSENAIKLRNKHLSQETILIAPELIFLEVTNALRYKKDYSEKIKKANEDLWSFQLKVEKLSKELLDKAIEIAIKNDFTIYDSIYIALAQIYETELITADEKLLKVPGVKFIGEVE